MNFELITNTVNQISNYAKNLWRSLVLLWTAAPIEIIILAILLLFQSVIPAASIWIIQQVVDTVVTAWSEGIEASFLNITILLSFWVVAMLLESILPPWEELASTEVSNKLEAHINLTIMRKADSFADLIRFEDPSFYDQLEVIKRKAYQPLNLLRSLSQVFSQLFTVITTLALLFPLGWWIPLLILVTTIPQNYVSFNLRKDAWEMYADKASVGRKMQYYFSLMLSDTYAKEVRLFGLGSFFIKRYQEAFEDRDRTRRDLEVKQALFSSGFSVFRVAGNGFAFYSVVQQAISGTITPGNVTLFIQSLANAQQSITWLTGSFFFLQDSLFSMEGLFNFLDSEPTMKVPIPGTPVALPLKSGITFENVDFAYPDGRQALTGVSFTLHPGETVALVGENGAGKTTLIKLLSRLYDPTQGNIWIDGENLKELNLEAWRRQIAVVFQDFCRYSLTVGENIGVGNIETLDDLEKLKQAAEKSGIATKVEELTEEYSTLLGKQYGGTELSGGEWQKIALARAFVREDSSQLLVLDEPTAALDPRSEYEIYTRFSELVRGKTAILVTHRLASVRMADRILVLKAGKLIEQGTHEELLQLGGEYATLWNMQAERYQNDNSGEE